MYAEYSNSASSGPQLKYPSESIPSLWGCLLPSRKVQVISAFQFTFYIVLYMNFNLTINVKLM